MLLQASCERVQVSAQDMITAIITNDLMESHVRLYRTDEPAKAREVFMKDWIAGRIEWESTEFSGPNCRIQEGAFSPAFLMRLEGQTRPEPTRQQGVISYTWFCEGSPERKAHYVSAHFVKTNG